MQFLQPCLPSHELGMLLGGTGEGNWSSDVVAGFHPALSRDKVLICVLGAVEVLQCCRQGPRCGYCRCPEVKDKVCE